MGNQVQKLKAVSSRTNRSPPLIWSNISSANLNNQEWALNRWLSLEKNRRIISHCRWLKRRTRRSPLNPHSLRYPLSHLQQSINKKSRPPTSGQPWVSHVSLSSLCSLNRQTRSTPSSIPFRRLAPPVDLGTSKPSGLCNWGWCAWKRKWARLARTQIGILTGATTNMPALRLMLRRIPKRRARPAGTIL